MSLPRRYFLPALGALLLFVLAGYISGNIYGEKATTAKGTEWLFKKAIEKYQLLPGGDLVVYDELRVNYQGQSLGFYRDIPLGPEQNISDLWVGDTKRGRYKPGASARLGSSGAPGTYGVNDSRRNLYRIVWHHNTKDETVGFLNVFRVSNVAESYQDADLLRLRIWSNQWESALEDLQFQLKLPRELVARAQAGPTWLDPQVQISKGQVAVSAKDIPSGQALELFVYMPAGFLGPGAIQKAGNVPHIKESKIALFFIKSPPERAFIWGVLFLLLCLLPATLWLLFWQKRMRDADYSGDRLLYSPPKGSLVYGYALTEENITPWKGLKPSTALVATFLDLVARGFYGRDNVRGKNGDWRLQVSLPHPDKRPTETLTAGEKATLDYFDELLVGGPAVIDDLEDRLQKGQAALTRQKTATDVLQSDLRKGDKSQGARSYSFLVKAIALLWIWAGAVLIVLATTPPRMWGIIFLFVGLLGSMLVAFAVFRWPGDDFSRISEKEMRLVGPWRSYRDFVVAFPRMNDAPDLQAIIWERAFAAALLYGVAREFVKRARVDVPQLSESSLAFANTSYYGTSIGSSLVSAATPVSTSSSGGFSGGGFDGGGGGFDGGGGGSW